MTETLLYNISAISKVAGKRVRIFTWTGEPRAGIAKACKEAIDRGIINDFSEWRADLIVDTSRHYRTRDGRKVTIHEVKPLNAVGNEVTFPIKCSIREDKKYARSQYHILTHYGYESTNKDSGADIVGYWDAEVSA